MDQLSPSWLILSEGFRKSQALLAAKRISDIVFSIIVFVLMAPVAAAGGDRRVAGERSSGAVPAARVGLHGRTFQIIKFRSMRHESTPSKPAWTSEEDPRITRVGRFIRKFRLDEIPQLINVLLGDMSLVGPRPEQPGYTHVLEQEIPYYRQRHSLRPGITGWAQVKCGYGATVQESRMKLEYDLFYIKHLSMMLDMVILFETGEGNVIGAGCKVRPSQATAIQMSRQRRIAFHRNRSELQACVNAPQARCGCLLGRNFCCCLLLGCSRDPVVRAENSYKRAEKYLRENKPDAAVIELRRALQLNPQLAKAHFALGAVELQRGSDADGFPGVLRGFGRRSR